MKSQVQIGAPSFTEPQIPFTAADMAAFLAVDANSGTVRWTDNSPGNNILHGQWSSPSYAVLGGTPQVLFPGGDGWLYSFTPRGDGHGKSKLLWKLMENVLEVAIENARLEGQLASSAERDEVLRDLAAAHEGRKATVFEGQMDAIIVELKETKVENVLLKKKLAELEKRIIEIGERTATKPIYGQSSR